MNNRGIYIAAAILLAAIGLFYFFDVRSPPQGVGPSQLAAPVVIIDPATVAEIDVKANGKVLRVTRNLAEWRYSVCPADQPECPSKQADPTRSILLLQAILQLRPTKTIFGAPEGLPAYGLANGSRGEVDLRTQGGRTVALLIGAVAPDNSSIYVRLSDSNDIQAVPAGTIQTQVIGAIDAPPMPPPSPSPSAAAATSPSP